MLRVSTQEVATAESAQVRSRVLGVWSVTTDTPTLRQARDIVSAIREVRGYHNIKCLGTREGGARF